MKKFIGQSLKLTITPLDPLEPRLFLQNYAKAFVSGLLIGGLLVGLSVCTIQINQPPADHPLVVSIPTDPTQVCNDMAHELHSKMQTLQQQFDQCRKAQLSAPVLSPPVDNYHTDSAKPAATSYDVHSPSPTIQSLSPVTSPTTAEAPSRSSHPLTSIITPPSLPPLTHRDISDDLPSDTHVPRPPAPPAKLRTSPSTANISPPAITTDESFSGKSFLLDVGEQKNLKTGLSVRLVAVSNRNTGQFCIIGLNNDQAQRIASGSTAILRSSSGLSLKIFTKAVTASRCQITLP